MKRSALRRRPIQGRYATSSQKLAVLRRDGFQCRYCGRSVTMATANADHVIPWKDGGATEIGNLVACCQDCNRAKSNDPAPPFYNGF